MKEKLWIIKEQRYKDGNFHEQNYLKLTNGQIDINNYIWNSIVLNSKTFNNDKILKHENVCIYF